VALCTKRTSLESLLIGEMIAMKSDNCSDEINASNNPIFKEKKHDFE